MYLWVRWERYYGRRGFSPMVNLGVFKIPSFRNGIIIVALYFLGMTSVWVLIPMFVQMAVGFTAFQAGMVGIPSALFSAYSRSEEHTSELQSRGHLVCRLLLEKKNKHIPIVVNFIPTT